MIEETTARDRRARNDSVYDYSGTNGAHWHSTDHMQLRAGNLSVHDFKSAEENVTSLSVMVLADEKDSGGRSLSWSWLGRIVRARVDRGDLFSRLFKIVLERDC